MYNSLASPQLIHGWVASPDSRGTLDIVWACVTAVFLCVWVAVSLNVPAPTDTKITIFFRRVRWMVMALLIPEFVLFIAAGQNHRATCAVADFKSMGYHEWTIRIAFFAEMGGFLLDSPDCGIFPVNNEHILFLVSKGYIDLPQYAVKEIWDKSKADSLIKAVTVMQTAWLLLNVIARWAQHLAVTTMELSSIAIVVCTFGTFYCWFNKPVDVGESIRIRMNTSISDVRAATGQSPIGAASGKSTEGWPMHPLDFKDTTLPTYSANFWNFGKHLTGPARKPMARFTNDRTPQLFWSMTIITFTIAASQAAIHLGGWDFYFPTRAEQILWRTSSLILFVTTIGILLLSLIPSLVTFLKQRQQKQADEGEKRPDPEMKSPRELEREEAQAMTPDRFPTPGFYFASVALIVVYLTARWYILVEAFISLRELPKSAFQNVNWSASIPHV